jgi:hypothetical protein
MDDHTFRVGDVVRVGRACMENDPGALALVIEIYDRRRNRIGDGLGATLLFPNGAFCGFAPEELPLFHVTFDHHVAALASYEFQNAFRVDVDMRAGRFAAAWG